tara:strand:- start:2602 stop:2958 length:357 start_codon:yes stop_codon:yes gene_type:complete
MSEKIGYTDVADKTIQKQYIIERMEKYLMQYSTEKLMDLYLNIKEKAYLNNIDMTKEEIINKITLLDTSLYRIKGHHDSIGIYAKEPSGFRNELKELYEELSINSLNQLLKLKQNGTT